MQLLGWNCQSPLNQIFGRVRLSIPQEKKLWMGWRTRPSYFCKKSIIALGDRPRALSTSRSRSHLKSSTEATRICYNFQHS
jgi:hypothetical protein